MDNISRFKSMRGGQLFKFVALVFGFVLAISVAPVSSAEAKVVFTSTLQSSELTTSILSDSESGVISGSFIRLADDGETDVWDGSIDVSWYNTTDTEFHLSTGAQLAGLAAITSPSSMEAWQSDNQTSRADGILVDSFAGKTVYLDADIDLNNLNYLPISDMNCWGGGGAGTSGGTYGDDTYGYVGWQGTFDGQGHTVTNMMLDGTINCSTNFGGYQGFISAIGKGGVVRNLGVEGTVIARVGGGIVGCSNFNEADTVDMTLLDWPRIENCWSDVDVDGNGSGSRGCGGIFGGESDYRAMCNIINCYALGNIDNTQAGGVSGSTNGIVSGCFFAGKVSGSYTGAITSTLWLPSSSSDDYKAIGAFINNMAVEGSDASNGNLYRAQETATGNPTATTDGFSTVAELKAAASTLGNAYAADASNVNNGYPILYWQVEGASSEATDISSATVAAIENQSYTGLEVEPALTVTLDGTTLVQNVDFLVIYEDNIETGTNTAKAVAYGIGRYTGQTAEVTFSITQIALDECTIEPIDNQWCYGDPVEPTLTVTDAEGNTLTEGVDYEVTYTNNDATGKATATITPVGSGTTGSNSVDFYVVMAAASLQGSGTDEDPYLIGTKGELQYMAHMVNIGDETYAKASYKLTADIDASLQGETDAEFDCIGRYYTEKDPETGSTITYRNSFAGTFDGDGHTISVNITSYSSSTYGAGLFPYVGDYDATSNGEDVEVVIENLTVTGSVAQCSTSYVAAFVGYVAGGSTVHLTMDNCTNYASVNSSRGTYATYAAAFVSYCYYPATITNCVNYGSITALNDAGTSGSYAGSVVAWTYGMNSDETFVIADCMNYGAISGSSTGGIVGYAGMHGDLTIVRCGNEGAITGKAVSGGIAGTLLTTKSTGTALIDSCYNAGNVTSTSAAGGISGNLTYGSNYITNCYNAGAVATTSTSSAVSYAVGGLVGIANSGSSAAGDAAVSGYNAGSLSGNTKAGLLGYANLKNTSVTYTVRLNGLYSDEVDVSHTYSTSANQTIIDNAVAASLDEIKAGADALGPSFFAATDGGYPQLYWQAEEETQDISEATVSAIEDQAYTGSAITPAITVTLDGAELVEGRDYYLAYENNTDKGQATCTINGLGVYYGTSKSVSFNIGASSLTDGATVSSISAKWAAGGTIPAEPSVTVTDANGNTLTKGTDYGVVYANNTTTGTATATITGIGNYTGTLTVDYQVYATGVESLEGSGTEADPYLIGSKNEMEFFALAVNNNYQDYRFAYVKLTNDIDISAGDTLQVDSIGGYGGYTSLSTTTYYSDTTAFMGVFDGDDHTIMLDQTYTASYGGVFKLVDGATIKNVITEGTVASSASYGATLVGQTYGNPTTIENCINYADVTATATGASGFAGYIATSEVSFVDCVNYGTITTSTGYASGFTTYMYGAAGSPTGATGVSFIDCMNYGDISSGNGGSSLSYAGGFVGITSSATYMYPYITMERCGNAGDITSTGAAGGLVGRAYAGASGGITVTMTDVYNTGDITVNGSASASSSSRQGAGGLVGTMFAYGSLEVTNAYNAGTIETRSGNYFLAGSILSSQSASTVSVVLDNVYYGEDTATSSIGYVASSAKVTDNSQTLSDAAMRSGLAELLGDAFAEDTTGNNGGYPVFDSTNYDISVCVIPALSSEYYTGDAVEPSVRVLDVSSGSTVELTEGEDYDVFYADNVEVGTATVRVIGVGSYSGMKETTFNIVEAPLSTCTIEAIEDQVATGEALEPALAITNEAGNELTAGVDYDAYYVNNVNPGTARVHVIAKGNYTGITTVEFTIAAGSIEDAEISGIESNYEETGEAVAIEPVVTLNDRTLEEGSDYTVTILDDAGNAVDEVTDAGEYTVVITGIGNYTGEVEISTSVGTWFTVYLTDEANNTTKQVVKEYTQAEFEALASSTDPVSGLVYKSGAWNVYTSDYYVTIEALLADAGLSDEFAESHGAYLEIGDGSFTSELTYEDYTTKTNFYPSLEANGTTAGESVNSPAILALTYASSTVETTAGDAETANVSNQSSIDHPRLISGADEEMVTNQSAAGKRFASGCNEVTLVVPQTILVQYMVGETGDVEVAAEYTMDELEEIAQANGTSGGAAVSGMFYKSDVWHVTSSNDYVTLEDLFTAAGIGDAWTEGAKLLYGGDDPASPDKGAQTYTYEQITSQNKFFPNASAGESLDSDVYRDAPAVLTLTEYSGASDGSTLATAGDVETYNLENANTTNTPRIIYGISESDYLDPDNGSVAGMRYWSSVSAVTIVIPVTFSDAEVTGIEESYVETGSAIEPVPTVTLDGKTLVEGTDYSVSYSDNTEPGTATVTITPMGDYAGQDAITIEFTIAEDTSSTESEPDTPGTSDDEGTTDVYAGEGRYETATAIAQEIASNGSYSGVIVASAENDKFADALSGAGLSGVLDYPIVLVNGSADSLDANATASLEAIADGSKLDVIVLGGTGTVTEGVASALASYDSDGEVVRIAGDDRYATAEQVYIYGAAHGTWNTSAAFVVKGNDFPDALAAASYCAANDAPLMLTDQNSDELPSWVTEALNDYDSALVIGGTDSVSDDKLAIINETVKGSASRMNGTDRYDTALQLVEWELDNGMSLEGAGFATGVSFPDALGSASLLAQTNSVLVLVSPNDSNNTAIYTMLSEKGSEVTSVRIFGGVNSVPEDVRTSIQSALGGTWSVVDKAA